MKNIKIFTALLIAFVFVGVGGYLLVPKSNFDEPSPGESNKGNLSFEIPEEYKNPVTIYWFWRVDCPYCKKLRPYIKRFKEQPAVNVKSFEVSQNRKNQRVLKAVSHAYNMEHVGVPLTFVGDEYWIGFDKKFIEEMKKAIVDCATGSSKCPSPLDRVSPLKLP